MNSLNKVIENKKREIEQDLTVNSSTVNSKNRSLSTVNSKEDDEQPKSLEEEIEAVRKRHNISTEGAAKYIAEMLDDVKSLRYYELLVKEHKPDFLIDRAHYVKDMYLQGKVRTNKAIYFQAILRKLKMRTRFRKAT